MCAVTVLPCQRGVITAVGHQVTNTNFVVHMWMCMYLELTSNEHNYYNPHSVPQFCPELHPMQVKAVQCNITQSQRGQQAYV